MSRQPPWAGRRGAVTAAVTVAVAVAVAIPLLLGVAHGAFSGQSAITGNRFTIEGVALGAAPGTAVLTYSGMLPGDVSTPGSITVSNNGGTPLHYSVTASATNPDSKDLRTQLQLVIRTLDGTTPASPCNDFDGSPLYSGPLTGAGGLLLGDPATGSHVGDRALAPGASEVLCFRASLLLTAANSYTSATTTATFTFSAESI